MAKTVTARRVGGSIGVTLPKDMADSLGLKAGDTLTVLRTDQGVLLSPYDPAFEAGMRAFEEVNARYRNALRELASK